VPIVINILFYILVKNVPHKNVFGYNVMAPLIGTINVFYQGMEHFESGLIQIFNLKFNHVKAYFTEEDYCKLLLNVFIL
jgi:hypothetical protein